ncbi:MAG: hypothetical protein SGI97_10370 [candidate division Zixibacteria bacterium]|nr:hypothetical protein [candidate division Zixibacteria bacterium]
MSEMERGVAFPWDMEEKSGIPGSEYISAVSAEMAETGKVYSMFLPPASELREYAYANAATCPECDSGMVRQGGCCSCPSCGFSSCGM